MSDADLPQEVLKFRKDRVDPQPENNSVKRDII